MYSLLNISFLRTDEVATKA